MNFINQISWTVSRTWNVRTKDSKLNSGTFIFWLNNFIFVWADFDAYYKQSYMPAMNDQVYFQKCMTPFTSKDTGYPWTWFTLIELTCSLSVGFFPKIV
jgi:hypothetical protein